MLLFLFWNLSRLADRLNATRFKRPHIAAGQNGRTGEKTFVAVHHINDHLAIRLFVAIIWPPTSATDHQPFVATICRPTPASPPAKVAQNAALRESNQRHSGDQIFCSDPLPTRPERQRNQLILRRFYFAFAPTFAGAQAAINQI
jgi:hypothetical protein